MEGGAGDGLRCLRKRSHFGTGYQETSKNYFHDSHVLILGVRPQMTTHPPQPPFMTPHTNKNGVDLLRT